LCQNKYGYNHVEENIDFKRKNIMALFTMLKDQLVSLEIKKYFCLNRGDKLEKLHAHLKAPSLAVIKVALFLNPSRCLFS
jgi:hypothetical protein